MLINTPKHEKFHQLGPKDFTWGDAKDAVCFISVSRQTISDETMQINCPVFANDTREVLEDRLGMLQSIAQNRIEDAAKAWEEAESAVKNEEARAAKVEANQHKRR